MTDLTSHKQTFKTALTTTGIHDTCFKRESVMDYIKAQAEDEVIRTISLAETKDHGVPYSYDIDAKGKIDFVVPMGLHKAEQKEMEAGAKNHERKFAVMRRLQARLREKGVEVKALPPISFKR